VFLEDIELCSFYESMQATEVGVRIVGVLGAGPIHGRRAVHLGLSSSSAHMISMIRNIVQLEKRLSTIRRADSWAFLDEMRCEAIDAAFGKSFSAGLAGVLVAIAGVIELCATSEVLKNQRCRIVLALDFRGEK
jgi:hypothetical protein